MTTRGYTIIEMLIYGLVMTILMSALIVSVFSLRTLYERTFVLRAMTTTGQNVIDRVVREIRAADIVNIGGSAFGVEYGTLSLLSTATTTIFTSSTSSININVNGISGGEFIPSGMTVNAFHLYRYVNTDTEMVRVELILSTANTFASTTKTFYGGAVLRGAYTN